jgi:hypothetical protein
VNEKPDYSNWSRAALMELAYQQIAEIKAKQERIDELQHDLKIMHAEWRSMLAKSCTS